MSAVTLSFRSKGVFEVEPAFYARSCLYDRSNGASIVAVSTVTDHPSWHMRFRKDGHVIDLSPYFFPRGAMPSIEDGKARVVIQIPVNSVIDLTDAHGEVAELLLQTQTGATVSNAITFQRERETIWQ